MNTGNEEVFSAISNQEFKSWSGIPESLTYSKFLERFPGFRDSYGLGFLGEKNVKTKYTIHQVDGYKLNIEAWFHDDEIRQLILNFPVFSYKHSELWSVLGEPEIKLDYFLDVLSVKQGVWVYPKLGIVLFMDVGLTEIMKVGLFKSCLLQYYLDEIHFNEEISE